MKLTRNGHPCAKELLAYVSRQPGSICIFGTLPWAASLLHLGEAFQCKHPSRVESTPPHCVHLCIGLTHEEQTRTPIELGSMTRKVVEAEGYGRASWQAWLHTDGVTPHIHVVASLPNSSGQGTANCIHRSGELPSNSVLSKVLP